MRFKRYMEASCQWLQGNWVSDSKLLNHLAADVQARAKIEGNSSQLWSR